MRPRRATELADAASFHAKCTVADWTDVDVVQTCQHLSAPDLRTEDPEVRAVLVKHLNHLIVRGVSGFRILNTALINAAELELILQELQPTAASISAALGIQQRSPTILYDLWPPSLMRTPWKQPSDDGFTRNYEYDLKSDAYVDIGVERSFVTDPAFGLVAADAWRCFGAVAESSRHHPCTANLLDLTSSASDETVRNVYAGYAHPRWQMRVRQPPKRISRALNSPAINAFAIVNCSGGYCPSWPTLADSVDGAELTVLATAWSMALPGGPVSVFSSYDWERRLHAGKQGWPEDRRFWAGPPRTDAGGTAPVTCAVNGDNGDITPAFDDDGRRWLCEHRHPLITAMPRWRQEVDEAIGVTHIRGEDGIVAFARGVEQRGGLRRAGWILLATHQPAASIVSYDTGLPAGRYCDQSTGLSDMGADLRRCAHSISVDWRGRLAIEWPNSPPNGRQLASPRSVALVLHTGAAALTLRGLDVSGMFFVLLIWLTMLFCPLVIWCRMWHRTNLEVRLKSGVCTLEHNSPGVDPVGHLAAPSSCPTPQKAGVLMAGLEHVVPALKLKISAGGLGNVAGLYVERLPCPGKFVFAKVSPINGVPDYSSFTPVEPILLDDGATIIKVHARAHVHVHTPTHANNSHL